MSDFEKYLKNVGEVGKVISVNNVISYCEGLNGAKIWEKIFFEEGQIGIVGAIDEKLTEVFVLDSKNVALGSMAVRTGEPFTVSVSNSAVGRILDVFGKPIDGKGPLKNTESRYPDSVAPPIIDRARINQNLETGITLVDLLIPLGKGQRQLVIGSQKIGKTSFLAGVMARQAQLGTINVYVLIGKKKGDLPTTVSRLKRLGAMDNTIIIAAPASSPTSVIYLAPFVAFSIAEYFKDKGQDVLLILDEISRHAKYYRELSILSKKMPGRDGYPGDIFHLHAHLMERAGRFILGGKSDEETISLKIKGKSASITCLPVAETIGADLTGYIQTNLISMTDGHIFFDVNAFQEGLRPAINLGLSVTRVGRQTLNVVEREMAKKAQDILFEYSRVQNVAKFGVELLEATRDRIEKGEKLNAILEQRGEEIIPRSVQLLFLELLFSGFWKEKTVAEIKVNKFSILEAYEKGKLDDLIKGIDSSLELGSLTKFSNVVLQNLGEVERVCGTKKT
jgi:F-type H+/Na+-transporting ATPase subunit alpha